jgi:soluble P-type ATPase
MIEINIPGLNSFEFENLVLDYNGTLALDGIPYDCVYGLLELLSKNLNIYILTADTFGNVSRFADKLHSEVVILKSLPISNAKSEFVQKIGKEKTIAIGNGRNDEFMLQNAALGIGLIQKEGISTQTLKSADIIFVSICDALNAILHPKRLIAGLRT